ncbi:MAG TPA: histone-like nucleoid-structuring protein Lsr2, partial [Streptosporangiaceae bacterium]|nr:histone-like nucleoid-structuring protein Lsr2 [Streptosporangiaceae bacterium]
MVWRPYLNSEDLHAERSTAVAQRTQVLFTDDIDGTEAAGTVRFGIGGTEYEIDLSQAHADQLAAALGPYVAAARKVAAARRPARTGRPVRH